MKKYERWIVVILLLIIVSSLITIKVNNWYTHEQGDTALIYQLTDNIASKGLPISNIYSSIAHFFESGIVSKPASEVDDNLLQASDRVSDNYFEIHPYAILYLIAPLSWIIPTNILLQSLMVLSFFGMLFLVYVYLRRNDISIISSILFCILIASHPAFSQSIQGQVYIDRLFIFFGFLFICLITSTTPKYKFIIALGFICLIMHERTAMIAGLFSFGYALLHWRGNIKLRNFQLIIGASLVTLSIIIQKLFINYTYYNNFLPKSLSELISRLSNPDFIDKLSLFAIFNIVILGIIAVVNWRAFLLALVIMIPNMIGNLGGAEKVGWLTHYHSLYFPVLVWAAMVGYIKLSQRLKTKAKQIFLLVFVGILISCTIGLNPNQFNKIQFSLENINYNVFYRTYKEIPIYISQNGKALCKMKKDIQDAVPEGSIVSVTEGGMTSLYENRELHYFPIGIEKADYAYLAILGQNESGPIYGGVVSYLGQENIDDFNKIVIEKMKKMGYDFENPVIISSISKAIIKRDPKIEMP